MRQASAMAEKVIEGRKRVIQVRVAVDTPPDADLGDTHGWSLRRPAAQ